MTETEATMKTRAGELRDVARALRMERADADVRRACQMFGAEEEVEDLDRRISSAEAEAGELESQAQVLRNEAQVEASKRDREEKTRIDEAVAYTDRIRREFREALAGRGWYTSPGVGRERIERAALADVAAAHGQAVADFCRERVLPSLSPAASASAGGR